MQKILGWFGNPSDVLATLTIFGAALMGTIALTRAYLSWPLESQMAMAIGIGLAATRTVPPIAAAIRITAIALGQRIGILVRLIPILSEPETMADQLRGETIEGSDQALSHVLIKYGNALATGSEHWAIRSTIENNLGVTTAVADTVLSELIIHGVAKVVWEPESDYSDSGARYSVIYSLTELGAETLRVLRKQGDRSG